MRLRIVHETAYAFETPANGSIQTLRLTPRGHDGQFVVNWRIEVDQDCRLETVTDPFGNTVHAFNTEGKLDGLTITALGEVETHDMAGMVRGQPERFPVGVFLRDTPLTDPDAAIRAFAYRLDRETPSERLAKLHAIMGHIHDAIAPEPQERDSAAATFAEKKGDARAMAHLFIAVARALRIPARYASGYLFREDGEAQDREYGWAEAFIGGVGWIGFDAGLNLCPTDLYVRLAVGLDRAGAAPVRSFAYGPGSTAPSVRVEVQEATLRKRLG